MGLVVDLLVAPSFLPYHQGIAPPGHYCACVCVYKVEKTNVKTPDNLGYTKIVGY
jgi:hypothetical protein